MSLFSIKHFTYNNTMATNPDEKYNPANDDNQGVAQLMAQAEQASQTIGVKQNPQMGMAAAIGQDEVAQQPANESDTDANGVNDEMLTEEDVQERNE